MSSTDPTRTMAIPTIMKSVGSRRSPHVWPVGVSRQNMPGPRQLIAAMYRGVRPPPMRAPGNPRGETLPTIPHTIMPAAAMRKNIPIESHPAIPKVTKKPVTAQWSTGRHGSGPCLGDGDVDTLLFLNQVFERSLKLNSMPVHWRESRKPDESARPMPTPPSQDASRSGETKTRLLDAAREVSCAEGVAGASARKIAAAAGVNQALVFYHFASVNDLIAAASNFYVDEALEQYRQQFETAQTLTDLLRIAEGLRSREGEKGNVAFMAQVLAAAHTPVIGEAATYALESWTAQIARVVERITGGTVLPELIDVDGLAPLITGAFIGLELYEGAHPQGGESAARTLGLVTQTIDSLLTAGPVARRALSQAAKRLK